MIYHIERITTTPQRNIMKSFINEYHSYINYADRPSRKIYWMLYENNERVGIFGLGSCFHRPKAVSNFMESNSIVFNEVANNIVYCLANHKGRNAGSSLLALCRKDAILWWYERYGDILRAFQTFILPPRTGAVYKADNWKELGNTTGGRTLITNTIRKVVYDENPDKYPNIEIRTFKNGQTKYLWRTFKTTEPKLIFMKLNTSKLIHKILKIRDLDTNPKS